jgi:hypothetical protein
VFQSVLPLHECADPTTAESAVEPIHSIADSVAVEPLQSVADSATASATVTETS